jgi:hypothetical protein
LDQPFPNLASRHCRKFGQLRDHHSQQVQYRPCDVYFIISPAATDDNCTFNDTIEQEFKLQDLNDKPSYYLGNDLKHLPNGPYHISTGTYTKEMIPKCQADYQTVRKEISPIESKYHPEIDDLPLLQEDGTQDSQQIIGTCQQWLIVAGRFDLCYAMSLLSRLSAAP